MKPLTEEQLEDQCRRCLTLLHQPHRLELELPTIPAWPRHRAPPAAHSRTVLGVHESGASPSFRSLSLAQRLYTSVPTARPLPVRSVNSTDSPTTYRCHTSRR